MTYYNRERNIYYTSGTSLTIGIENGVFSGIPTVEQLEEWGFEEYIAPEPEPEPAPVETYEEIVVRLIRERYTINDELAIQRQRDSKPEDFAEYNAYCEYCKEEARKIIGAREEEV